MPKTIQQEAFLFSHELCKRLPHASERLMELMLSDTNQLLSPPILTELVRLMEGDRDLLEKFGRLFLPGNHGLEVWTNSMNESYCMLAKGDQLHRLCPLHATNSLRNERSVSNVASAAATAAALALKNLEAAEASNSIKSKGSASKSKVTTKSPSKATANKTPSSVPRNGHVAKKSGILDKKGTGSSSKQPPGKQLQPTKPAGNKTPKSSSSKEPTPKRARIEKEPDNKVKNAEPDKVESITTPAKVKSKRGRPKKVGAKRNCEKALDFVKDLTAAEMKEFLKSEGMPGFGAKAAMSARIITKLKLIETTPFSILPLNLKRFGN